MTLIAVISDVHANLPALEVVLAAIENDDVKEIWCAGDVLGYYTFPREVMQLIFAQCEDCIVKGNHDQAIALTEPPTEFTEIAANSIRWSVEQLTKKALHQLYALPHTLVLERGEKKILLLHGGPNYPLDQYLQKPETEEARNYLEEIVQFLELTQIDYLIHGHTHIPYVYRSSNHAILDAGSVGQPRDGDPRACYMLFELESGEVTHCRVPYDIQATVDCLSEYGLSEELGQRLFEGR